MFKEQLVNMFHVKGLGKHPRTTEVVWREKLCLRMTAGGEEGQREGSSNSCSASGPTCADARDPTTLWSGYQKTQRRKPKDAPEDYLTDRKVKEGTHIS